MAPGLHMQQLLHSVVLIHRYLTAATTGTVWLLVFCMAVYMVLNFRKELKEQCK